MRVELNRLPRVPFQRPVRVRAVEGSAPPRRMWAMNLSPGGMYIKGTHPPAVGVRIRVEVEFAQTVMPLAEAEVVWTRSDTNEENAGFGVRFLRVDPKSEKLVEAMLKHGGTAAA